MAHVVPQHDLDFYYSSPAVATLTLYAGWSPRASELLRAAVETVLRENVCLTGVIVYDEPTQAFVVKPGVHLGLVAFVDGPADFALPPTLVERLGAMQRQLEPLLAPHLIGSGKDQIDHGSQLFKVVVVALPRGHACVCVQLSHLLGDGATFYRLCEQLDAAAKAASPTTPMTSAEWPTLRWRPSPKAAPIPPEFSDADVELMLRGPIEAYVAKLMPEPPHLPRTPRQSAFEFVDAHAVAAVKRQAAVATRAPGEPSFVSTNDVVTASIAEAMSGRLLVVYANMRARLPGTASDDAGNYERGVQLPREAVAAHPAFVRTSLAARCVHYTAGCLPEAALRDADFAMISNWSSLTRLVVPPTTTVLAHAPLAAFVQSVPCDLALIFHADAHGTLAINHNLPQAASEQARTASSLYQRVVTPHQPFARSSADGAPTSARSSGKHVALLALAAAVLVGVLAAARRNRV